MSHRVDTACRTDGRMEWNQYTPTNFVAQRYDDCIKPLPKPILTKAHDGIGHH